MIYILKNKKIAALQIRVSSFCKAAALSFTVLPFVLSIISGQHRGYPVLLPAADHKV